MNLRQATKIVRRASIWDPPSPQSGEFIRGMYPRRTLLRAWKVWARRNLRTQFALAT